MGHGQINIWGLAAIGIAVGFIIAFPSTIRDIENIYRSYFQDQTILHTIEMKEDFKTKKQPFVEVYGIDTTLYTPEEGDAYVEVRMKNDGKDLAVVKQSSEVEVLSSTYDKVAESSRFEFLSELDKNTTTRPKLISAKLERSEVPVELKKNYILLFYITWHNEEGREFTNVESLYAFPKYLPEEPVAMYEFDYGSGQVAYDSTDNENDGTLGTTSSTENSDPEWVKGYDGYALNFTGSESDIVEVPSSESLNITGAMAIEMWVNPPTNLTTEANAWYGGVEKSGAYSLGWQGWTDGWTFNVYSGGARNFVDSTNYYVYQDRWYHVVGIYDGQYLKVYVNGTLAASKNVGALIIDTNSNPFVIGRIYGTYWNGKIDKVRIYNRSLTQTEIENLFKYG